MLIGSIALALAAILCIVAFFVARAERSQVHRSRSR